MKGTALVCNSSCVSLLPSFVITPLPTEPRAAEMETAPVGHWRWQYARNTKYSGPFSSKLDNTLTLFKVSLYIADLYDMLWHVILYTISCTTNHLAPKEPCILCDRDSPQEAPQRQDGRKSGPEVEESAVFWPARALGWGLVSAEAAREGIRLRL